MSNNFNESGKSKLDDLKFDLVKNKDLVCKDCKYRRRLPYNYKLYQGVCKSQPKTIP